MRRQLFISLGILTFLVLGTIAVVLYGMGNRLGFSQGKPVVSKTGILGVTSTPDAAQILIDGHLRTATNANINLTPGEYTVRIEKDGYFPWEKKIKIEKEVATKIDALLFPLSPKLEGIATGGVENPVADPSGTKIAFRISNSTLKKNGIYVLDMNTRPLLTLQSSATQVASDTDESAPFSKAIYTWSPDGRELLASISGTLETSYYLLKTNALNDQPQDVTPILSAVTEQWRLDQEEKDTARLTGLRPRPMQQLITKHFSVLSWSPDETKILYIASESAELPLMIKPRLLGINDMKEERKIENGKVYVYDTKEDTNIKLLDELTDNCGETITATCHAPLTWFPDSGHLIYVHEKKITLMEYDGGNATTVFAGPFEDSYVFPYPNGSKLVILTNLGNLAVPPTLYTIGLK